MSETYQKMCRPPKSALREIQAGRLKGKTDINPQWRYEVMDSTFGACGIGWKYEIVKLWTEPAPVGQLMCFSEIRAYVKNGDGWSDPIPGIGGSMLIEQESKGLHVSDEGFKMATTDALSVALKMLGVGGDIYAGLWDGAKYKDRPTETEPQAPSEYVTLKSSLIDWMAIEPKLLTDAGRQYANDMIQQKNIAGMKLALDKFKQAAKQRGDQ